jgi:hypothetical protein
MAITKNHPPYLAMVPLLWVLGAGACTENQLPANGGCVPYPGSASCAVGDASAESLGLVAYSCTGKARPDENPTYLDGVPQGLVCASQVALGSEGRQGYCCSAQVTPCAYDPVASCDLGTYGYQCRGADRPEALNAAVYCNQGVRHDDLIKYCCSGSKQPADCIQSDTVGCSAALVGWLCPVGNIPTSQDLGANKSRADLYYQLCSVPTPAANPSYNTFCCYTPGLAPVGSSCVQDIAVPGCQPDSVHPHPRFGFACYGPDTPEQDFAPMHCPDQGITGVSEQRYPATLYCCDFQ